MPDSKPEIERVYMSADVQHPKWTDRIEPVQDPLDLSFTSVTATNASIVKLDFSADGTSSSGNGFFVNLPKTRCKLILTAGHNLISASGQRTTNLSASYYYNDKYHKFNVNISDYRLSDAYEKGARTATADWGAILVDPKAVAQADLPPGFGYNIMLGQTKLKGVVYVTGYRASSSAQKGDPSTSTGQVDSHTTELRYKAQTEQGISGSVVWAGYRDMPVALAIHNNRQAGKPGGRGARITYAVIDEIYSWPGVLASETDSGAKSTDLLVPSPRQAVMIKAFAKDLKTLPAAGLYLSFPEGSPYAGVKLGSGAVFHVIPAYVRDTDQVYYGFLSEGKWMSFETSPRKEVMLDDVMRASSLLRKAERGKTEIIKPTRIYVVDGSANLQLQLEWKRLDEDQEDAESSEAYLVDYPSKNMLSFTEFKLEPVKA